MDADIAERDLAVTAEANVLAASRVIVESMRTPAASPTSAAPGPGPTEADLPASGHAFDARPKS